MWKEIKETGYEDAKDKEMKLYTFLTVEAEDEHFDLRLRTDPSGRGTL